MHFTTGPFRILEPEDQKIDEFYAFQECGATDFEAPEL